MDAPVGTLLFILFIQQCVVGSLACNGYELNINHIKNCGTNDIIKVQNPNFILDKDCNVVSSGCMKVTKPIKTTQAHVTFKKPPLPTYETDVDVCAQIDPQRKEMLAAAGLPDKCPIAAKAVCGDPNKKISLAKYKKQIGLMAGTSSIIVKMVHDSGKSCIDVNYTIKKRPSG